MLLRRFALLPDSLSLWASQSPMSQHIRFHVQTSWGWFLSLATRRAWTNVSFPIPETGAALTSTRLARGENTATYMLQREGGPGGAQVRGRDREPHCPAGARLSKKGGQGEVTSGGERPCLGIWEHVPCSPSPAPGLAQGFEQRGHLLFQQKQVPWKQPGPQDWRGQSQFHLRSGDGSGAGSRRWSPPSCTLMREV